MRKSPVLAVGLDHTSDHQADANGSASEHQDGDKKGCWPEFYVHAHKYSQKQRHKAYTDDHPSPDLFFKGKQQNDADENGQHHHAEGRIVTTCDEAQVESHPHHGILCDEESTQNKKGQPRKQTLHKRNSPFT